MTALNPTKQLYLFVLAFMLTSLSIQAQVGDSVSNHHSQEPQKEGSSRVLETHLFGSWHKVTGVFTWKYDPYINTIERVRLDTLINDDFSDFPFLKNDVGATFLGASGSAAQSLDFFKRKESKHLLFFTPYTSYTRMREDARFFNTKTPYTLLSYHTAGAKKNSEDNLLVTLSQNVTPELNLALYYQRYGAKGFYENQGTDTRVFNFTANYAGKRYSAHAGYLYNAATNRENGGIADDRSITDTVLDAELIKVNLGRATNAQNKLRSNTFFLTQSYGLPIHLFKQKDSLEVGEGTIVYVGHSAEYTQQYRSYTDYIASNSGVSYYDNFYIDPNYSRDSSFMSSLDNRAFIRLQPWSPEAIVSAVDGGVGLELSSYYGFSPDEYLQKVSNSSYTDMYMYAKASGMLHKYFSWSGFGRYYISGYRQNDLLVDATARVSAYPFNRRVDLTGRLVLENKEPDYFYKAYHSNHFKWNRSLDKQVGSRFEVTLSAPEYEFEAGFRQSVTSGFVYMDANATPAQYNGALSVTGLYLMKNFKLGILRLDNRILFQLSSNEDVLALPRFSFNSKWYLQVNVVKSVLTGQLGADVFFNTKYYIPAYNPAVGLFHNQNEKEVGSYPMIDVFVNFKWKRATFFVKYSNVAQNSFNSEYFSALHYPRNGAMLRLGLSWQFYN